MTRRAHSLARKKQLGQYFTPPPLAGFAWELLGLFQSEGESRHPRISGRILEPAIGEGVFFHEGLSRGVGTLQWVGFDIDPTLETIWEQLRNHHPGLQLIRANALLPHPELKTPFEVVIGNPPFGAEGVEVLEQGLEHYEIARHPGTARRKQLPIECFFMERSVQLCAAEGWIALIVPEGILANLRWQGVRDWLLERTTVRAIVKLPMEAFRAEKTTAQTALILLQKAKLSSPAVMLDIRKTAKMSHALQEARHLLKTPSGKPEGATLVSQTDLEGQRWDTSFWASTPLEPLQLLRNRFELAPLGEFITHLTYGPILTGRKPSDYPGTVLILGQRNLAPSGLNPVMCDRVAADSPFDPARSRPRQGDLLFARSGMGSLAKGRMAVLEVDMPANLTCFVDLIRFHDLDPHFAWLFLASRFGQNQIQRLINGVGTPNLSFSEIRGLQIPVLPTQQQLELTRPYHAAARPLHLRYVELDAAGSAERTAAGHAAAQEMMKVLTRFEHQLSELHSRA